MGITTDILRSWRSPRAVIRARLAAGLREDRALAVLMAACFLMYLAQLPGHARAAHLDPSVPFQARVGGSLLALMFLLPPLLYGVAGLSHIGLKAVGGQGSAHGARIALFWSLLAVSPATLLHGLVAGVAGPGPGLTLLGLAVLLAFLLIWGSALAEVGFGHPAVPG